MNNKKVVSIGVQLDYKKELESMLADLKRNLNDIKNSSGDIELSKNLQSQIRAVEDELSGLARYVKDSFASMGSTKVDLSDFIKLQSDVDAKLSKIESKFDQLRNSAELLNATFKEGESGVAVVNRMTNEFSKMKSTVRDSVTMMQTLFQTIDKAGSKAVINFQKFSFQDAIDSAKELKKYIDDDNYNPYASRVDDASEDTLKKTLDEEKKIEKSLSEIRAERKTALDLGTPNDDPYIQYLDLRIELMKKRRDSLIDVASDLWDELDKVMKVPDKYTNRYNKAIDVKNSDPSNIEDVKRSRNQMVATLNKASQEAKDKAAEVSSFIIKNGAIQVPIKISSTPAGLTKEITKALEAVKDSVKPIEVGVKLVSATAKGEHGKITQKAAMEEINKDTEEFASKFNEVTSGGELDLGKSFEKTYSTTLKAAQKMAEAAISEIRKQLTENKIVINPDIQIKDEDLAKVKETLEQTTEGIDLTEQVKIIAESFSNILNKESVDLFVDYFSEAFGELLSSGGGIEDGLLTALNKATNKWRDHFFEVFGLISTQLQSEIGNLTKNGDKEQQIDLTALASIDTWKKQFIESIALVSMTLLSDLTSASQKSAKAWESGMLVAVENIADKAKGFVLQSQGIQATGLVGGQNELYYNMRGWRDADRILREERVGKSPAQLKNDELPLDAIARRMAFSLSKKIIDNIKFAGYDVPEHMENIIKATSTPIKFEEKLYRLLNMKDVVRPYNGELERGGLYNSKTGEFYNGYVFDQPHSIRDVITYGNVTIDSPEDIVGIHSHPSDRMLTHSNNYETKGYDLNFSGSGGRGDFYNYLGHFKTGGPKKWGLESDGMIALLDFTSLTLKQMEQIVAKYDKYRSETSFVKAFDEQQQYTYYDMSETSKQTEKALRGIIDEVLGKVGASEDIYKVADVEELKNHPEKFSNFIPQNTIQEQRDNIASYADDIKIIADAISHAFDGLHFEIDESTFTNIIAYLEEIQNLISRAFNVATTDQINDKWAEVSSTFKDIVADEKNLTKAGALKTSSSQNLIRSLDEYYKMGGTSQIENIAGITTVQAKKLQSDYAKYTAKQIPKAVESSASPSDLESQLNQIDSAAKELYPSLEKLIKILGDLKNAMSSDAASETGYVLDHLHDDVVDIADGLNAISPESIKNFKDLIRALGNKNLGEFKMPEGLKAFVQDLDALSGRAQELENIATILKSVSKGKNIGDVLSGQEQAGTTSKISESDFNILYKDILDERTKALSGAGYQYVGDTDIQRLKTGVVELTTVVQDANGAWKELKATVGSDFGINESAVKNLTEAQGLSRTGQTKNKYDPSAKLNELSGLYSEANNRAKKYAETQAKLNAGFSVQELNPKELSNYERVLRILEQIAAIEQELNENDVNIAASRGVGAKYATYHRNNLAPENISSNSDYREFSGRMGTFKTQVEDGKTAINSLIGSLRQIDGTDDLITKITQDFSLLVTELGEGSIGAETFNERWGKIVSKYRDIQGYYTGDLGRDANSKDIENELRRQMETFTQRSDIDFGKGLQSGKNGIDKLVGKFRDANNELKTFTAEIDRNTGAIRVYQSSTQQYVNGLDKFFTSLKAKMQEGLRYLLAYVSVRDLWRYLQQGIQVVREYDTALTEMRKVSDESVTSLKALQQQSFAWADEVGTTAVQLQNSIADFMRLGQATEQAIDSAKTANILMNVSEFESIGDATTALIAMEQAYQDLSATEIVDKLNNIGNNYAIATDELSVALQNSASALTTAGNTMDEAVAVITAGNLEVQDASKTGTGLQTIALRLTGTKEAKAELEELGEETDDVITTQSKLRDTILNATKVASNEFQGFDILGDNGQYKSTYEILLGIAEIWEEIQETDTKTGNLNRNLLLETLAGKRRANIAASILENPDILRSVYESSQDSAGSAAEELSKYLDSIEGKMQQFNNAVQKLSTDLINNELVKWFVDLGTAGVNALDAIAGKIPLITTALSALSAIGLDKLGFQLISFGRNEETGKVGITGNILSSLAQRGIEWDDGTKNVYSAFEKYVESTPGASKTKGGFADFIGNNESLVQSSQFADTINEMANGFKQLSDDEKNARFEMGNFTGTIAKTKGLTSSLGNTFKQLGASIASGLASFGISLAINLAIQGAIMLFDKLHESKKEIAEAGQSAKAEFDKIGSGLEDTKKSAEDAAEAYDRLSHGVDTSTNTNRSLSTEEYQEYIEACNTIAELSPSFKSGVDTQGNAIVDFTGKVTSANEALKNFIEREERVAATAQSEEAYDIIKAGLQKQAEYEEERKQLESDAGSYESLINNSDGVRLAIAKQLESYAKGESSMIYVNAEQIKALGSQWIDVRNSLMDFFRTNDILFEDITPDPSNGFQVNLYPSDDLPENIVSEYNVAFREVARGVSDAADTASTQLGDKLLESSSDWQDSVDAALTYVTSTDRYYNLSDNVQNAIKNAAYKNLKPEDFFDEKGNRLDESAVKKYMRDNYLNPITTAWNTEFVDEIGGTQAQKYRDALTSLFEIDPNLTADEYTAQVDKIISSLSGYFKRIGISGISAEDFKTRFGLSFEIDLGFVDANGEAVTSDNYSDAITELMEHRGFNYTDELKEYVAQMTIQQQMDIVAALKDPAKFEAEISTLIRGAIMEGVGATSTYLTNYATKQAKDTSEVYKNVVSAFTNEMPKLATGVVDKDFARFIGGYNEGEDDSLQYLNQSISNVVSNAQKAKRYFTEDGLGLYSFAEDIKGITDVLGSDLFKQVQKDALSNMFGDSISENRLDKLVTGYQEWQDASFNGEDTENVEKLYDRLMGIVDGFSEDGLIGLLDETDARFIKIKKDGTVSFKRTDRAVDVLSKALNQSKEETDLLLSSLDAMGEINLNEIAFQSLQNDINIAKSNVEALTSALSEMGSQGYLSASTVGNLLAANPGYSSLLINAPSGTIVDANEVRQKIRDQAQAQYDLAEAQKNTFKTTAGENYQQMLEIVASSVSKGTDATEVLNRVLAGEDRWLEKIGEKNVDEIFSLASANKSLEGYIGNIENLQQELRGSVSAMTEYKNAQSTANLSDNYATIDSGQEAADKLYEQGWVGKDDFITYAALVADYGEQQQEYVDNYEKNMKRMSKYLTEDTTGLATFLEDATKASQYVSKVGETFEIEIPNISDVIDEATGEARSGMDVFAESMHMTMETATDLLLALNDAGLDFKLTGMPDALREGLSKAVEAGDIDAYERWMERVEKATEKGFEGVEQLESDVVDTTEKMFQGLGTEAQQFASELSNGTNVIGDYVYRFDEAGNYIDRWSTATINAKNNLEQLDATSETYHDDLTRLSRDFAALPEEEKVKLNIDGLSQQEIQNKIVTGELKADIPADLQFPEDVEQVDMTVAISQQSISDIYNAITAAINGVPFTPTVDTSNVEDQVTSAVNSGFAKATPTVPSASAPVQTRSEVSVSADTSGYTSALSAISNTTTKANIGLNSSSFDSGLRRVNSSLSALGGRTISPSVTLGVSTFYAALNGVNAALDKLNGRNVVTTITTVRKVIGDPGKASGSFILPWASGTFTPAHASGTDVSIDSDEDALINEIGQESIVRDGRFMLIPGGAHIEHLKKGDIVFSAKQTEELLRSGRVTSGGGHGKAYADGTFNAYALGGTGGGAFKKKTSSSSGSKSSGKSSSGASSGNSGGNNGNSAADANDPEKFDWIEIRLQRLQDKIDNFDLKLQSVYSNWSDRNYALSRELVKTSDLMDNQAAAYNRYIKEANSVGLSAAYKKKVQDGTIDIEKISDENLRKKIDEYQQWYDKAMECKYAIDELKESYKELYKTQFENWEKYWQEQMDLIDAQEELYKYVRNGFSKTLTSVDKNVDNAVKKVADLTIAFNHAVQLGGIKKYSEAWYEMAQTIEEAKLAVYEYQSQAIEAINEEIDGLNKLNEARRNYYSSRGAFTGERSELVETIRNEVNRVNQLQARLLKDAETNGAQYITSAAYKERLAEIYEAMNGVTEAYKNLIALDKGYYDNLINLNNVYSDTVQKAYALDEAFGNYESVNKYAKQIESLRYNLGQAEAQAATMTQDLEDAVNSGAIKLGSTEWLQQKIAVQEVNNSILDYKKSIEDANQALINLKYEEMFERAIEKANAFIDKLETINELLTDEMMYDYNNGFLTESGMLSLILNDQSLDEHIENLKKFVKERQQIIDDYNNGEFGTESYEERMKEVESSINSELKAVQSSRNAILTIIKTQTKAELDALNKVIDARKEALRKKKDYWDYDKELKDKNKEIQLLKQQIQALQGVRINCPIHFNCWELLRDIRTTTQG